MPLRADVQSGDLPLGPLPSSSGQTVTGPIRTRRVGVLILLFLAALILAACGGGGDEAIPAGSTVASAATTDAAEEPDTGSQEVADDPDGDTQESVPGTLGENRAVVVIGDEQFEFEMSAACISMGGAVGGVGWTADGSVKLDLDIPPEDWETSPDRWDAPSVRISDRRDPNAESEWRTGGEVIADYEALRETVRVDAFTVQDGRAFGSATFMDLRAYDLAVVVGDTLPAPVAGTFDINCG